MLFLVRLALPCVLWAPLACASSHACAGAGASRHECSRANAALPSAMLLQSRNREKRVRLDENITLVKQNRTAEAIGQSEQNHTLANLSASRIHSQNLSQLLVPVGAAQSSSNGSSSLTWANFQVRLPVEIWMAAFTTTSAMLLVSTSSKTGPMAIIACYVASSICFQTMSKEVGVNFANPLLLVVIQMLVSSVVISILEAPRMECVRWRDAAKWLFVPFFMSCSLATSILSSRESSSSAVLIVANVLPLLLCCIEWKCTLITVPAQTWSILAALSMTLSGALLYGCMDNSARLASSIGKILIFVNCLCTLANRMIQTYLLQVDMYFSTSLPLCMLLNNSVGILPIVCIAWATGEIQSWTVVLSTASPLTWFWIMMSSVCSTCLGYAGLRMQQTVSGTTVLVMQNFNSTALIECFHPWQRVADKRVVRMPYFSSRDGVVQPIAPAC